MNIPDPRQYHYVVMFDEQTGKWQVDVETTENIFDGQGMVFDVNRQEWTTADVDPDGYEIYNKLEEELAEVLDNANEN